MLFPQSDVEGSSGGDLPESGKDSFLSPLEVPVIEYRFNSRVNETCNPFITDIILY